MKLKKKKKKAHRPLYFWRKLKKAKFLANSSNKLENISCDAEEGSLVVVVSPRVDL